MNQSAKAQEPSMEEILASIRRIIADDDTGKSTKPAEPPKPAPVPAPAASAAPSRPAPVAPPPAPRAPPPRPAPTPVANNQQDIDAMLANLDEAPKPVAPPPAPVAAKPAAPPSSDILDLTEAMAAPTPPPGPAPSFRTIDGNSDVVFTEQPAPRAGDDMRRQTIPSAAPDHGLISNTTMSAVDSAFNSLANTVLGNNARTLEDLVKEMLRPMLKGWLDDNLPGMVERIVRAEIERVSRGRP
jgi:cell pole-organizing protein PopZ